MGNRAFKRYLSMLLALAMTLGMTPVINVANAYETGYGLFGPVQAQSDYWTKYANTGLLDYSKTGGAVESVKDASKVIYAYYASKAMFVKPSASGSYTLYLGECNRTGEEEFDISISSPKSWEFTSAVGEASVTTSEYTYGSANSQSKWEQINITGFDAGEVIKVSAYKGIYYIVCGNPSDMSIQVFDSTNTEIANANKSDTIIKTQIGDELTFTGKVVSEGYNLSSSGVQWKSTSNNITVNNGVVTVNAADIATIYYTYDNGYMTKTAEFKVDSRPEEIPLVLYVGYNTTTDDAEVVAINADETVSGLEYAVSDSEDKTNLTWQSSKLFNGITEGTHYFWVKNANGIVSEPYKAVFPLTYSVTTGVDVFVYGEGLEVNDAEDKAFITDGSKPVYIIPRMINEGVELASVSQQCTKEDGPWFTCSHNEDQITAAYSCDCLGYKFISDTNMPFHGVFRANTIHEGKFESYKWFEPTSTYNNELYGAFTFENAPITVESIEVSGVKTEYTVGDEFEVVGDLNVTYSDSTTGTVAITGDMISGFDSTTAGTVTVTVTYEGKTTTFDVVINEPAPTVESIAVSGQKTDYYRGGQFIKQGTVTATYTDASTATVDLDESMVSGFDTSAVGTKTVTVTYEGKTATYDITVTLSPEDTKNVEITLECDNLNEWSKYKLIDIIGTPSENVDHLITPFGKVNSHNTSFLADRIGTYNFTANSIDGVNSDSNSITVTKIDNEKPVIIVGFNADWDKILFNAVDNGELDKLVMPGGDEYYPDELPLVLDADDVSVGTILAYDKAGNIASKDFSIVTGGNNLIIGDTGVDSTWTNKPFEIDVYASGNSEIGSLEVYSNSSTFDLRSSGQTALVPVAEYSDTKDADGSTLYTKRATFLIESNGTYEYRATVGSDSSAHMFTVSNIDVNAPVANFTMNGSLMNIDITDDLSGVKTIEVPSVRAIYMDAERQGVSRALRRQIDLSAFEDGEYEIVLTDYAGNKSVYTFEVSGGTADIGGITNETIDSFVVKFDMNVANTGVTLNNITAQVEAGSAYTVVDLDESCLEATKKFSCWRVESGAFAGDYQPGDVIENITENVTFKLVTEDRVYHTVSVMGNNSGYTDSVDTFEQGETFEFTEITVNDNLVFKGYSTTADGEVEYNVGDTVIVDDADLVFYVITEVKKYTVKINANNSGATAVNETIEHGSEFTLPEVTVSSNKEFKGFATTANGTVTYQPGDKITVTANIELFVITQNKVTGGGGVGGGSATTKYDIIISKASNGKVSVDKYEAAKGERVTITVTPADGYQLKTLTVTDDDGRKITVKNDQFTMPSTDVVIKAEFERIPATYGSNAYLDCKQGTNCLLSKYSDVNLTGWYHDGLHYAVENNIMVGYGDGTMKPDTAITRAMIVTMLWRIEGSKMVRQNLTFKDVDPNGWYIDALEWAVANGIVAGYSADAFGPNDTLTRQQLVTILHRYVQIKGLSSTYIQKNIKNFVDYNDIAEYALNSIQWAYNQGVIEGKANNILDPNGSATRAQVATIIKNLLG